MLDPKIENQEGSECNIVSKQEESLESLLTPKIELCDETLEDRNN